MNTKLDRDSEARPVKVNLCDAVRSREAAVYYGDPCAVNLYGYSHLSNAADDGGQDVLVLMHPRQHADDGHLVRIVPQEMPETGTRTPKIHSNTDVLGSQHETSSTSAVSNLRAAVEAVLGSTPTLPTEVEAVREERFAANGAVKFRGVTRHKRTLRFEAHIWESKKQIYLGGFESELLAARSHDIMALKCKGLDWGSLNFDRADYAQVIEVLPRVEKEDIIYCLREFSKIFGEPSDSSASGSSMQSHATHASTHSQQSLHLHPKGAHALKPALKIRKHADHGNHGNHGNHRQMPGTPRTPFNSSGHAPITPKDKLLPDIPMDVNVGTFALDSIGASLFDPEQPVDALCEQVVFLPNTGGAHDIKAETDPFSMLYDSFESHGALAGCRANIESRLGPVEATAVDMLDGGW